MAKLQMAFITPTGLLVDEVANDPALAAHPDVLWYPYHDIGVLQGNDPDQWWSSSVVANPTWVGPECSQVEVAAYGITKAIQHGSPYSPDHFYDSIGGFGTQPTYNDGQTIQRWNKWLNVDTQATNAIMGEHTGLQSGALTHLFYRWVTTIHTNVKDGMTEVGMKMSGFEPAQAGPRLTPEAMAIVLWYANPNGGTTTTLHRYMSSASGGSEQPSDYIDPGNPANGIPGVTITLGQQHCYEIEMKLNTSTSASDGILRIWVDDVLVYEDTAVQWYSAVAVGATAEIAMVCAQLYHGGQGEIPSQIISHTQWGHCLSTRRCGAPKVV